jgi:hypothetical protein
LDPAPFGSSLARLHTFRDQAALELGNAAKDAEHQIRYPLSTTSSPAPVY